MMEMKTTIAIVNAGDGEALTAMLTLHSFDGQNGGGKSWSEVAGFEGKSTGGVDTWYLQKTKVCWTMTLARIGSMQRRNDFIFADGASVPKQGCIMSGGCLRATINMCTSGNIDGCMLVAGLKVAIEGGSRCTCWCLAEQIIQLKKTLSGIMWYAVFGACHCNIGCCSVEGVSDAWDRAKRVNLWVQ